MKNFLFLILLIPFFYLFANEEVVSEKKLKYSNSMFYLRSGIIYNEKMNPHIGLGYRKIFNIMIFDLSLNFMRNNNKNAFQIINGLYFGMPFLKQENKYYIGISLGMGGAQKNFFFHFKDFPKNFYDIYCTNINTIFMSESFVFGAQWRNDFFTELQTSWFSCMRAHSNFNITEKPFIFLNFGKAF
jgi:hypothetical protein